MLQREATVEERTPERAPGMGRPGIDSPFRDYHLGSSYDEMFTRDGAVRPHYAALHERLSTLPLEDLYRRQAACEQSFLHQGITFTVYGQEQTTERIIPTDLLPRIVTAAEWAHIERGLIQRITALNLFLKDIYHDARVIADGVIPRELVFERSISGARCAASPFRATPMSTSVARTSSGARMALSSFSKTICGCHPAFPTCSPTARW